MSVAVDESHKASGVSAPEWGTLLFALSRMGQALQCKRESHRDADDTGEGENMSVSMRDALGRYSSPTAAPSDGSATATQAPTAGIQTTSEPAQEAAPEIQAETSESAPATGEPTAAPPAAATTQANDDDSDPHPVPRKALIEERKKRQELERQFHEAQGRLKAYEERLSQPVQQPAQQEPQVDPLTDFYSNPVGFLDKRISAVKQEAHRQFLNASEAMVRAQHSDYDEKLQGFAEAAKTQRHLWHQMNESPNPAMFAYEMGSNYLEAQKYGGSMEEMKKKLEAEIRAKVEAEWKKKQALNAADQANTSIAGARGTGASAAAGFAGPTPMSMAVRPKK